MQKDYRLCGFGLYLLRGVAVPETGTLRYTSKCMPSSTTRLAGRP